MMDFLKKKKKRCIKWRSYPCEKRANLLTALGKLIR